MIRELQLENFKAFGNRVSVPLAPITLIFGENSSGKSSILPSLNLLKQTRESREVGALLLPRTDHGLVDLGSFQEIIFDHELKRSLSIRVELDFDERFAPPFFNKLIGMNKLRKSISMELSFHRPSLNEEVHLHSIKIYLPSELEPLAEFKSTDMSDKIRQDLLRFARRDRKPRNTKMKAAKCTFITKNPTYWISSYDQTIKTKKDILEILNAMEARIKTINTKDKQLFIFGDLELKDTVGKIKAV